MNQLIKSFLRKPYRFLQVLFKTNWIKTLRVNFALLPFSQAIKLPIVVIGRLKIASLSGQVKFECPARFGLVLIGKTVDNMPIELNTSQLLVKGTLIFKGRCIIGRSANVVVWPHGEMYLGHCVRIGSGVLLKCNCKITIADCTRITSGCFVMDTNVHAIKDIVTGRVKRIAKPIEIGKCCWLTMNTSVTAGAKIPDYSISTRNAVLNRDYTESGEIGCLLAGSPARVLRSGIQRVFDLREEAKIARYFHENPNVEYYESTLGFEQIEDIDIESDFNI